MCNDETLIIDKTDFNCIGQVAKHCEQDKLCISISEAQEFDLEGLFCDFWQYILSVNLELDTYNNSVTACAGDLACIAALTKPTNYDLKTNLICGGDYNGCNDKIRSHKGVKRILVYYAYSRYLLINGFNDTPSGSVTKTNEFSMPKPLKEIQSFADKYRTMGYDSYKKTLSFICNNKDMFTEFNGDCEYCGCGGNCKKATSAKGYGIRTSIISKGVDFNYSNRILNDNHNGNLR